MAQEANLMLSVPSKKDVELALISRGKEKQAYGSSRAAGTGAASWIATGLSLEERK